MNSYNRRLLELRTAKGLTLKQLSKQVNINVFMLYLYENGYFRPSNKAIYKLQAFYNEEISTKGIDAYPTPTNIEEPKPHNRPLFIKRIVFGILSLLALASSITGSAIFNKSVNNDESYYGDVYNQLRTKTIQEGVIGHDLVTALEFYRIDKKVGESEASIVFYKTDNILFFNQLTYTDSYLDLNRGVCRTHLTFGEWLGVSSYECEYTFASIGTGAFFTCNFVYDGGPVTELYNFNLRVKGTEEIDESLALELLQPRLSSAEGLLSSLISEKLGGTYSLYNDFLPAREQGRRVNFKMQITSLFLIILGTFFFFIFFGFFLGYVVTNIKPRLVSTKNSRHKQVLDSLPNDIDVKISSSLK